MIKKMKNEYLHTRLVVIGNGFDLAHKLPTQYSNFINQLKQDDSDFHHNICKYIPEEFLWSSFEEALAELNVEQLQDDNSCYLLGYGDDNWRDSAHHDFQYMIEEALSFAPAIPQYLSKWIHNIDTASSPTAMPEHIISQHNLYLSFNYTDTLERIYNIPTENITYIHGKARRGDYLIVGHHSDDLVQDKPEPQFENEEDCLIYYDNCNEDVRVTEAKEIIKSYFKSTYKDTEKNIEANQEFFDSLSHISEIYIYGHSLSDIDFAYFQKICSCVLPCCKWYISYHSESDYKNALRFVQNLGISIYQLYKA